MKPAIFATQVAAFVDEFEPSLLQVCDLMTPFPKKWAHQFESWFTLCRAAPYEAFADEGALAEVLETLVSLMHARMTFGLCAIPRYGQHPKIMVSGDLGGAVLIEVARDRVLRLAARHDREMACRLADIVLRRIEAQRRTIAEMMSKSI